MGLEWGCRNRPESTIPSHFLGIFGIFRGIKMTLVYKNGKFYLHAILYNHKNRQRFFMEVFPSVHRLGDR